MRFTVSHKIIAGLVTILVIGTLSMLIIYRGLAALQDAMHELADRREPSSAATYEMEINANGMGLAVLKYLDSAEPRYRELVEDDQDDFERFHAKYLQLAESERERKLGSRIATLYEEFKNLAEGLMRKKDEEEALFEVIGANFERIDGIIDEEIQAHVRRRDPGGLAKVEHLNDLEADFAEVAFWLANYQRTRKAEYKQFISVNEDEFRERLTSLKALGLTRTERRWVGELEATFDATMASSREILTLEEELAEQVGRFIDLREEVDRLLDTEIQVLALSALTQPRRDADRATATVLRTLRFLIPVFVLSVMGVAVLLIRLIIPPVKKLMRGTDAVSQGDLGYRIVPSGRDELAELAEHFNEMVAQLEATTVSKELLQKSETKLRETVADLRREVAERRLAEEEQARLQASLRRSETMSAMGALVAGVAHEVRNPLFGISSILDAMDARLGAREEYQRYVSVLRGQLDRLAELMRELLEYGRPQSLELSPGSTEDVVALAVDSCRPLAERSEVKLVNDVRRGFAPVAMDRRRLLQVFQNLIENAIQHSPRHGVVGVEAEETREDGLRWIACAVKDSGPGFRSEELARIFEPFFSRRRGGTGLGLSIVQRIVEEHGGRISVANRPEGGAVMTVRLPLSPPVA